MPGLYIARRLYKSRHNMIDERSLHGSGNGDITLKKSK